MMWHFRPWSQSVLCIEKLCPVKIYYIRALVCKIMRKIPNDFQQYLMESETAGCKQ